MPKQPAVWLPESLWAAYTDFLRLWRSHNRQPVESTHCYASGIDRDAIDRLQQRGALQRRQSLIQPNPNVHVAVMILTKSAPIPAERTLGFRDTGHIYPSIVESAQAEGVSLSDWLRDAARRKLESTK